MIAVVPTTPMEMPKFTPAPPSFGSSFCCWDHGMPASACVNTYTAPPGGFEAKGAL